LVKSSDYDVTVLHVESECNTLYIKALFALRSCQVNMVDDKSDHNIYKLERQVHLIDYIVHVWRILKLLTVALAQQC